MRRVLSILLLLILGLGPTAEASTADGLFSSLSAGWAGQKDESRLPICCRRNGKHHCTTMTSAQIRAQIASYSGETTVAAKNTCPLWPTALVSVATSIAALASAAPDSDLIQSEASLQPSEASAAITHQLHTWPKRGPPASSLL